MTDLARLEKLCGNLNHALVDVRLRAVQNLQFKLLSGVLGEGVYTSVSCMRSLSDGISASLQSLIAAGNEWQSPTSSACKLMEELLQLSHTIGLKAGLAPEAVHESLAVLLEKLYTISGKCGNADPMHRLAQKAIESICTIKTPTVNLTSQLSVSTGGDFNPVPSHMLHSPITTPAILGRTTPEPSSNEKLQRGAGAILQSALVYSGWKFAKVVLTDSDERYLFDLEVKLKLGHDTSVQFLWDAISDFPAPVLASRPGLIVAVLDLVGAVYTQDQLNSSPGGLNPLTAMAWLSALLEKCVAAFVMQLEGSLCSSVPASSQPIKPVDDVGSREHGKPSLAAQMAQAMYSLRYPLLPTVAAAEAREADLRQSSAAAPMSVSPVPSLPGLAFAACAAALPLLQGRDPQIAAQVLSLLKVALPIIREPIVASAEAANPEELAMTDRKRLQHLLNRIEQLLRFFEPIKLSVDRVLKLCAPLPGDQANEASLDEGNSTGNEERGSVSRVQQAAFESALLRCAVEVLLAVPEYSVRPVPEIVSDAEKANVTLLDVGAQTLSVVGDLVASAGGTTAMLESGEDRAVEAKLVAILRQADPAAVDAIDYASELLQSISSLQQMAEMGDSPRDVPTKYLLEKLLEKAHVVVNLLDCGSDALRDQMAEIASAIPEISVVLLAAAVSGCAESAGSGQSESSASVVVLRDAAVVSAVTLMVRLCCCCGTPIRQETLSCLLGVLTAGETRELSEKQVELLRTLDFRAFPLQFLLAALATPNFCHSLTLFGLLGADAADLAYTLDNSALVVAGSNPPVKEAMVVIEHLLSFVLTSRGLDVSVAGAWAPLLGPLKVCEWTFASDQTLQVPHAVLAFLSTLEDCCAASAPTSKARAAYGLALSLGLFHCSASVRSRNAVRLRYELVGLKAGSYEFEGGVALDPFAIKQTGATASLAPSLISWGVLQSIGNTPAVDDVDPQPRSHTPSRVANHSECRKLASMAFNPSHEIHIRSTALRQLSQVLRDKHLMSTAEGGWCVSMAAGCARLLNASGAFRVEHSGAAAGGSSGVAASRGALADARLALEAASLLRLLVCESAAVRAAAVFAPPAQPQGDGESQGDSTAFYPTLDVPLWPLLQVVLRSAPTQSTAMSAEQELETMLLETQALCCQTLAALVHDSNRWSDDLSAAPTSVAMAQSGFQTIYSDVPASSSGSSRRPSQAHPGASPLHIPVFLTSAFNYVLQQQVAAAAAAATPAHAHNSISRALSELAEEARADVWPFEVTVLRCELRMRVSSGGAATSATSGRVRPLPTRHVMSLVARAAFSPELPALLSETASLLCAAIATAPSHKALRALVAAARALGRALPGLFGAMVVEDLRLALSRLFSVAPRTRNDTITLSVALGLLTEVIPSCAQVHRAAVSGGGDAAWEVTQATSVLLEEVAGAVLAPLFPILADFRESTAGLAQAALSPGFTSRDHVARDGDAELSFALRDAQRAILELLAALCAVPYPLLSLKTALEDHALPHVLMQLVASELAPSWKRARAAAVLESLVTLHGIRPMLVQPAPAGGCGDDSGMALSPSAASRGGDACPMDLLLKSIKLLRTPDSLRDNGCTISSLRLFYLCIQQFVVSEAKASDEEGKWWRRVRDWGWIMRLGWDRRGEVRLLTMSILGALLPVLPEVQGKSLAITVDSLEAGAAGGGSGTGTMAGAGAGTGASSAEWPPVESLLHVLLDCSEAHAVRAVALQCLLSPACSHGISSEHLVVAAMDLIGTPSSQFARLQCAGSIAGSSSSIALTALMSYVTRFPAAEVASATKALRLLPTLMSLVRNDLRADHQQAALFRAGLVIRPDDSELGLFGGRGSGGVGGAGARAGGGAGASLRDVHPGTLRHDGKRYSLCGGWERVWHQFVCSKLEVGASLTQAGACRVLVALAPIIGAAGAPSDKDVMLVAARQASLVRGVVSVLCSTDLLLQTPPGSAMQVAADRRCAAASDLLVFLVGLAPTGGQSVASGSTQVTSLMQASPSAAGLLLRRLAVRFEQALLDSVHAVPEQTVCFISSSLRLLCTLLDMPVFVAQLRELDWGGGGGNGADEDGGESSANSPVYEFTRALLRLRLALLELEPVPLLLSTRIDVCLGFWCQAVPSTKAVMYSASSTPRSEGMAFPQPLLDHYIETLGQAVAELASGTGAGAAGGGASSGGAGAAAGAGAAHRRSPSPSPNGAPVLSATIRAKKRPSALRGPLMSKPTENPKWRNQTRGFSFSSPTSPIEREREAHKAPSLSPRTRSATYAALIALTGCLTHPTGARRALALGLGATLGALAKATQAWGVVPSASNAYGSGWGWAPTNAELSAAVLAACCSFTHANNDAKVALAAAGESVLRGGAGSSSGSGSDSASSNLLHQLASVGIYSSVQPSSRHLSLALCASLLRAPASSPSVQKAALAHVLSLGLQRALVSSKVVDAEAASHLLDALSSCMAAEAVGGAASGGSGYGPGRDITNLVSQLRDAKGSPDGMPVDADFRPASVPQLLGWTVESLSHRPDVLAAAIRSLASLSSVAAAEGTPAAKRLFAIAGSREPMRLLMAAAASDNSTLASLAHVALWIVVHGSSSALASARALVAPTPLADFVLASRPSGIYGNYASRAASHLLTLIQGSAVQSC